MDSTIKCKKCPRKALDEKAAKGLCAGCFIKLLQQRLRREMKGMGAVSQENDQSLEGAVLSHLLSLPGRPRRDSHKLLTIRSKRDERALPVEAASADMIAEMTLDRYFFGTKMRSGPYLLTTSNREECSIYAKIHGLKYTEKDINSILERIKDISPDAAFAIAKTGKKWLAQKDK